MRQNKQQLFKVVVLVDPLSSQFAGLPAGSDDVLQYIATRRIQFVVGVVDKALIQLFIGDVITGAPFDDLLQPGHIETLQKRSKHFFDFFVKGRHELP